MRITGSGCTSMERRWPQIQSGLFLITLWLLRLKTVSADDVFLLSTVFNPSNVYKCLVGHKVYTWGQRTSWKYFKANIIFELEVAYKSKISLPNLVYDPTMFTYVVALMTSVHLGLVPLKDMFWYFFIFCTFLTVIWIFSLIRLFCF